MVAQAHSQAPADLISYRLNVLQCHNVINRHAGKKIIAISCSTVHVHLQIFTLSGSSCNLVNAPVTDGNSSLISLSWSSRRRICTKIMIINCYSGAEGKMYPRIMAANTQRAIYTHYKYTFLQDYTPGIHRNFLWPHSCV